MTTGSFWDVTNPLKPFGLWDEQAQLNIPFDWVTWLASAGATYVSHVILPDTDVFENVSSAEQSGIVMALIKMKAAPTYTLGTKYKVTCRITASASGLTLIDDRTVWLKIAER